MKNDVYHRLRERLHEMPNGFPSSKSGVEIDLLKKIFTEEEAELFLKLKISFESLEDIALRTGMEKEALSKKFREMRNKGQLFGIYMGDMTFYRAMPFIFGIFEFQLNRLDREFSALFEGSMKKQKIDAPNGAIAVHESAGQGPPVVLIHGNSSSSRAFSRQL